MRLLKGIAVWLLAFGTLNLLASDNVQALPKELGGVEKSHRRSFLQEELLNNLDVIKQTFRIKYAPAEWKRLLNGWDLETKISEAKARALADDNLTLHGCRQILADFFNGCNDYHVKLLFLSTEFSYLPIRVTSSNDRYFITWIDREILKGCHCDVFVGDEVLYFDDQLIGNAVSELQERHFGNANWATDHALAELTLTLRSGEMGMHAKQGFASLVLLREGQEIQRDVPWIYGKEEIASPFAAKSYNPLKGKLGEQPYFHRKMQLPWISAIDSIASRLRHLGFRKDDIIDNDFFPIGNKYSHVPVLGTILWKALEHKNFHAYIYRHPWNNTRVAYLRIPSYGSPTAAHIEELEKLIKKFEKYSDLLVIDQVCNPGGDLFYLYAIASMLTDVPLSLPFHKMSITQNDVFTALQNLDALSDVDTEEVVQEQFGRNFLSGYRIDYSFVDKLKDHFKFMIAQWDEGKYLTDPCALYGIDKITPHPTVRYTKPILMLIDSLDFSGGDFMPAIMKDNDRATLLGSPTAGAGGFVLRGYLPNHLGISYYSYTASLAERPTGIPIENLGVTPHILYSPSPDDLQNGYCNYARVINWAAMLIHFNQAVQLD
jgi:hypothetical protein